VLDGVYSLPDSYFFLAPKGLSTQFNMMVSKPTTFRDTFLGKLVKGDALVKDCNNPRLQVVRELAADTDFGMFRSVELVDALDTHSRTRWHAARFATALPARGTDQAPPAEYAPDEARYLQQLLAVYAERRPDKITNLASVENVPQLSSHLQRQRVSFFRAESLKGYAREAVPPGTFEKLQDDIYAGVVDIAERDHPNGYTRLSEVLSGVGQLDLNRHRLIAVADINDRKGVCHQLANDDRLAWVEDA
jgi:ABC-3C protein